MNIIEAIKSGKRYKRSSWAFYMDAVTPLKDFSFKFSIDDILANDWQVEKEEKRELSWDDIATAIGKCIPDQLSIKWGKLHKELGFGE